MNEDTLIQQAADEPDGIQLADTHVPRVGWPDDVRGIPWIYVRSAVFGPLPPMERTAYLHDKLVTAADIHVQVFGWRLSELDLDILLECVHFARFEEEGSDIVWTEAALLEALGLVSRGGKDRQWVRAALERLATILVIARGRGVDFEGPLLEAYARGEKPGSFVFRIPVQLWAAYRAGYVQIKVADRRALRGNQLALWLHAYYASHHRIVALKPDTLAQYCGSRTKGAKFRRRLHAAMNEVRSKTGLFTWCFDKHGNVAVFRSDQCSPEYRQVKEASPGATHVEIKAELAWQRLLEYGPA